MKKSASVFLAIVIFCGSLSGNFSSLTPTERATIETALGQAWEWRAFIEGKEDRRIVEAVNVQGENWRIRVEFAVPQLDGGRRVLVRDVLVTIKTPRPSSTWPYAIGGFAVGFGFGVAFLAIFRK